MKISILSPNLSDNCLGRAYLLAKILQRRYEVEIVGPIFANGIWGPVADDKCITYKSVEMGGRFKPYWQIIELVKKIDGDVIFASKPLLTSFGIGLFKKAINNKLLILDIDDWQLGFIKEIFKYKSLPYRLKDLIDSTLFIYNTRSYWNNLCCEKLFHFADEIIVSNKFLKNKFGGKIVWHARDTELFNPKRFEPRSIKKQYGIGDSKKIVMFFGTPRQYKGVEDLIKAISVIKDQDVVLVIVGIDNRDQYSKQLAESAKKALGKRFKGFGLQRFETVPEFLTMADIVVIPQRKNFSTMGQMPAKVFDAMAMAKPIIASNISDLPEILAGCGWIVEPENPAQLAEKIQYLLNAPFFAVTLGERNV